MLKGVEKAAAESGGTPTTVEARNDRRRRGRPGSRGGARRIHACCVRAWASRRGHGQPVTVADLLAGSPAEDWRVPDPEDTLYLDLARGRVVIELASHVAPQHVANIRELARAHYFDGLAIVRVQDNYVVQWDDPDHHGPVPAVVRSAVEFTAVAGADTRFHPLPDRDAYAPQVGFLDGFPAARDPRSHIVWLAHCHGMVGAGATIRPRVMAPRCMR